MKRGRWLHPILLPSVLALSIAQRPRRLSKLWESVRTGRKRKMLLEEVGVGEFLSSGVLPEYTREIDAESGLRVAAALFNHAPDYFRSRCFTRIEWNVEKDNLRARLFYLSIGATMEKSAAAWPADYRVTLRLH